MIVDWLAHAPVLIVAVAVVFGPGLLIGTGLRLRGFALWALAPVASTATVAGLAVLYGLLGIGWTAVAAVLGCLVVAAFAWVGGLLLGPRSPSASRVGGSRRLLTAGLVLGIGFTMARFIVYVDDPTAISQTNDAVFHLNALRYILESGSASSLDVSAVVGGAGFYPAAWHGLTSLTALISGADVVTAATMVSLVIAAGIWPIGIAFLTYQATGRRTAPAAIAALFASALHVFPMLMFQWGVLYPYALSVSLLPAVIAVVVSAPDWIAGRGPLAGGARAGVLVGVMLIGGVGALALAQPAGILALAIAVLSFSAWWVIGAWKGLRRGGCVAALVALALVLAASVAAWYLLTRSTSGSHWPPFRGNTQALVDVLIGGYVLLPAAVGMSVLTLIGVVVAVRRPRLRWLATMWILLLGLYVAAAAVGNPLIRTWLLGGWYADPYRIAALVPVAAIPLAGIGLAAVAAWAARILSDGRADRSGTRGPAWALGVAAVVMGVWFAVSPVEQMTAVTEGIADDESRYVTREYLSDDERELLEELPEYVDADARIIGNPSTGMGFGYMLSGLDVYPRTWAHPRADAWQTIESGLRDAADDPAVCDALEVYGSPEYVLDFGEGEARPGRYVLPGMTDFEGQGGFEFVAEQGDASLWRITACAP